MDDIAMGDRGVWHRVVPGINIPVYVHKDIRWAYGYLLPDTFTHSQWRNDALNWRILRGVASSTIEKADEADQSLKCSPN